MASTKVKAIVLGGVNIKEKDKLVTLFTLENGLMTASMKGVRGDKAKLKASKDIFTFGDFVIEEGKFSNIITSVDVIDNFYGLSKDIDKYYEACAILDIVKTISTEPSPPLFIELIKALKTLCYENAGKYYVIDKFLLSILKAMGYQFFSDKCSSCGAPLNLRYLNLDVGELVCPACKTSLSIQLSNACYSAMKILDKTDYNRLSTVKLGGMGEVQAFNALCKNYKFRTGKSVIEIA